MSLKITNLGVEDNGFGTPQLTPKSMGMLAQYGSPTLYRGHNVSSVTAVTASRVTFNLLSSMGGAAYVVYAQSLRNNANTARDIITCIDGNSSATTSTSFSLRNESEASNNVTWRHTHFATWY